MTDKLILKSINELLGEHFYIPHYQRGYRWTSQQVTDLLKDIWVFTSTKRKDKENENEFYCLQPIVVKEKEWIENGESLKGWEVIDGQQRLTTIFIILSYLANEFMKVDDLKDDYGKDIYSLRYETRPQSEAFLKEIKADKSNIDYYHIYSAYDTIKGWFTNGSNTKDRTDKNKFLGTLLGKKEDDRSVQVIWYMVEPKADSIELFTRLNIGKIPLTNAELIKALFLSSSSFAAESPEEAIRMKLEISQMWDEMELKLNDDDFWSFVTNAKKNGYSTKIELVFDMIADKKKEEDPLSTFLYFMNQSKDTSTSLWKLWIEIEKYYMTLCEWYKDKNLYHKVGYLITNGNNLRDLIESSMQERKDDFESVLDDLIRQSVDFDIEDLSYDSNSDYRKIEKILLLFNVESIRFNKSITEFYPFRFHKDTNWSLEHIHAQNSDSLDKTKKDPWLKWLEYHKNLIQELLTEGTDVERKTNLNDLFNKIQAVDKDKLTWEKFNSLSQDVIRCFSEQHDDHTNDMHSISNLALLSQPHNAALNNAVFEVKRREIISLDKNGTYIPICTKRVFLKYYNDKPSSQQYYFWGKDDRNNYLKEIKKVLKNYLPMENKIEN